jgi:hypothetical protein
MEALISWKLMAILPSNTPGIWDSMLDLIEGIHIDPIGKFGNEELSVRDGFKFEKWELVFNELEVALEVEDYNACKFKEYDTEKHPLFGF